MIIFDGAIGTLLKSYGYDSCFPYLNIKNPELILKIHKNYIKSGAVALKTNTFNADLMTLKECGYEDRIKDINLKGIDILKKAIDESGKKDILVIGDIGPSVKRYNQVKNNDFIESAYIQTNVFLENGVDIILLETMVSIKETELLLKGIFKAFEEFGVQKEIIVSLTPGQNGNFLIEGSLRDLEELKKNKKIDYIGLNCGSGICSFEEALKKVNIDYLAPSLGLPIKSKDDEFFYEKTLKEYRKEINSLVSGKNVKFLGGCCGTTPKHIKILKNTFN